MEFGIGSPVDGRGGNQWAQALGRIRTAERQLREAESTVDAALRGGYLSGAGSHALRACLDRVLEARAHVQRAAMEQGAADTGTVGPPGDETSGRLSEERPR